MIRLPTITKNRYEILFFYENPSLLINKNINAKLNNEIIKLNNQEKNLNNQEKISNNQKSQIESTIEDLSTDENFAKNFKEILNKSNNKKKTVTAKNIGDINKKNNISYLNNYHNYSKLACFKFYFHYRDEDSLMKRLKGKPFEYKYEGQNSFFKTVLTYLSRPTFKFTLLNRLITDQHIKSLNENVNILKNILNNNISKIKSLPECKKLNNSQIENIVNDLKIEMMNDLRKKDKEYENKSDEEITKIMLEKINKVGTINKDFIIKKSKSNLNKTFLDLTKVQQEEIKNILRLEKPNILKNFENINSKKKEYFKNNIKKAFEKIQVINPNIKYCLVLDIKKSLPYKLNKVDKEYNIQEGGKITINLGKLIIAIFLIIFKVILVPIITAADVVTFGLFPRFFTTSLKWIFEL
jgi:hypothetical protein